MRQAGSVAVVIPAYEAGATLAAALASVAAQSVAPAEVVIGDDGSTDDTIAVARSWEDRLPIRVARTSRNLGPAGARHAAIEISTSPLLALLDADDVWFPDHLSSMLAAFATTDDGLASADVLRWIPGEAIGAEPLSAGSVLPSPDRQLAWLLAANRLSVAGLFSRSRYDQVGGFRTRFVGTEDWDLWIRMVRAGAVVVRPGHPTMLYRLRVGSVSSAERMVEARLAVLAAATAEAGPLATEEERQAIALGIRTTRAEGCLYTSYALATSGRLFAARIAGLRALRGIGPVAFRGAAMAIAPGHVSRRRERVRDDPDVWLRRYGPGGSAK